jgi:allantoicase
LHGSNAASFTGLVDLAAAQLGGRAVGVSDDFFAGVENLIQPERAVFIADKFTERGKWMDGWESRRKRTPGYDWCILQLGASGHVLGLDIDTAHFNGNHPSYASVEGVYAPHGSSLETLEKLTWSELLPQSPLRPDSQNLFATSATSPVNFIRLNIFPDGGVARLRVFGKVVAEWSDEPRDAETLARVPPALVDLAAVKNGGVALACSDARFGPMNNLLLPGRAANMGGGWETRRSRQPNQDWILLRLAARGTPSVIELDTNHFFGNFPDRCSIDTIDAPHARITDLIASSAWVTLLPETKLQASRRHFFGLSSFARGGATHFDAGGLFDAALRVPCVCSHVRLNIFPDGGISRLRVWGTRDG